MYYRNAAAAIVAYDVTKAVRAFDTLSRNGRMLTKSAVLAGEGKELGQGASATGKLQHRYCVRR